MAASCSALKISRLFGAGEGYARAPIAFQVTSWYEDGLAFVPAAVRAAGLAVQGASGVGFSQRSEMLSEGPVSVVAATGRSSRWGEGRSVQIPTTPSRLCCLPSERGES